MKFKLKKSNIRLTKESWNKWFAWHPIKITNRTYIWLIYVERIAMSPNFDFGNFRMWDWDYRVLTKEVIS